MTCVAGASVPAGTITGYLAGEVLPELVEQAMVIPLLVDGRSELGLRERRMLRLVPITAVGALIIPGGLTPIEGDLC